jgi:hypothetical protein
MTKMTLKQIKKNRKSGGEAWVLRKQFKDGRLSLSYYRTEAEARSEPIDDSVKSYEIVSIRKKRRGPISGLVLD